MDDTIKKLGALLASVGDRFNEWNLHKRGAGEDKTVQTMRLDIGRVTGYSVSIDVTLWHRDGIFTMAAEGKHCFEGAPLKDFDIDCDCDGSVEDLWASIDEKLKSLEVLELL